MRAIGLDHVGVVTRDLGELTAQYERLGFTLTPFARQADGRIGNRCVMLQRSYLELLALVDPNAHSATIERFLARYAGIHILAFAMADEQTELARLRRAGIVEPVAVGVERPVDDADAAGKRARFMLIQLPDQPEGRINLVRHLTRDALWQEKFMRHENNAVALDGIELAVEEPIETAARLSRLVGCAVVPEAAGSLALDLAHGRVRIIAAGSSAGEVPRITGMTIRTSDGNAAVSRLVTERGIAHRLSDTGVDVGADVGGGVAIRFIAQGYVSISHLV
jgi:hypothetical protein